MRQPRPSQMNLNEAVKFALRLLMTASEFDSATGGVNPAAVERMTRVKGGWGRVVWMPTFDAENQVRYSKESRPFVRVSKGGTLLPEVREVLALIAHNGLTLATGHSSPAEDLMHSSVDELSQLSGRLQQEALKTK